MLTKAEANKKILHCLVVEDTGERVFLQMTYPEWEKRIWSDGYSKHWCITLDDGRKTHDFPDLARKKSLQCAGTWPMTSYAAGVHPDQVPEMMKIDAENGVPTQYNSDGDPEFTSKSHRNMYCRVHKMHDRDAGYSDPVPG